MTNTTLPRAELQAAVNTDEELWREREGDYYANSIHVTQDGKIGMNVGGTVFVMPIKAWHDAARLAQQEEKPEPVAWIDLQKAADQIIKEKVVYKRFIDGTPLANDIPCWMADFAEHYTAPPQREWQGLTDEEIEKLFVWQDWSEYFVEYEPVARAIEAKLKEKNT